jgi:hypothetical protein
MFQFNWKNPQTRFKACLQHQPRHNCDATVHLLWYLVHGCVQSHHFHLPVSICGDLSSVLAWRVRSCHQTVTEDQACPAICYSSATLHSSMFANTRWWKGLCSKDFQHSDTKTAEFGSEVHTEYNVIFMDDILHKAKLLLNTAMPKLF